MSSLLYLLAIATTAMGSCNVARSLNSTSSNTTVCETALPTCGESQYNPSAYTCYEEKTLCPIVDGTPTLLCGDACYLESQYRCENGALVSLSQSGAAPSGTFVPYPSEAGEPAAPTGVYSTPIIPDESLPYPTEAGEPAAPTEGYSTPIVPNESLPYPSEAGEPASPTGDYSTPIIPDESAPYSNSSGPLAIPSAAYPSAAVPSAALPSAAVPSGPSSGGKSGSEPDTPIIANSSPGRPSAFDGLFSKPSFMASGLVVLGAALLL